MSVKSRLINLLHHRHLIHVCDKSINHINYHLRIRISHKKCLFIFIQRHSKISPASKSRYCVPTLNRRPSSRRAVWCESPLLLSLFCECNLQVVQSANTSSSSSSIYSSVYNNKKSFKSPDTDQQVRLKVARRSVIIAGKEFLNWVNLHLKSAFRRGL